MTSFNLQNFLTENKLTELSKKISEIDLNPSTEPSEEQRTRRGKLLYKITSTLNELVRKNKISTDPIEEVETAINSFLDIKNSELYKEVLRDSRINEEDDKI